MGTSSSHHGAGAGTPLLPSWAPDVPLPAEIPQDLSVAAEDAQAAAPLDTAPSDTRPPIEAPPTGDRFRAARNSFSRFVISGGTDRRALGRALHAHVETVSGGARTAARRMTASRKTAANLVWLLTGIARDGLSVTLRTLSLQHLAGRSPKEILAAFTDTVCSSGSLIDEGIARAAYVETVLELAEAEVDLQTLTKEQITAITLEFICRSIVLRVINDIGTKYDVKALSVEQAEAATQALRDLVSGAVQDRLREELEKTGALRSASLAESMNRIYEIAFNLIEGEATNLL